MWTASTIRINHSYYNNSNKIHYTVLKNIKNHTDLRCICYFKVCFRRLERYKTSQYIRTLLCRSWVFMNVSPTLSRSHTLCAALQKLEQRSSAPSKLCTLDIRGCRSQTLTQWVSRTQNTTSASRSDRLTDTEARSHNIYSIYLSGILLFLSMAFPPTRWRCQRNSISWSQRFEEEAPTAATFY